MCKIEIDYGTTHQTFYGSYAFPNTYMEETTNVDDYVVVLFDMNAVDEVGAQ